MVLLGTGLFLLVACHRDRDAAGPGQRAGQGLDNAAQKTGSALHKAAVKTDEAAHKAVHATGEAFERAGQKLKGSPGATQTKQNQKQPEP
jgi:hypothetical protein